MAKYIYLYRGPFMEMTPESGAAWGAWAGQVGAGLVDMGSPCGKGVKLFDNGKTADHSAVTGYSIVSAENLAAAQAMTKGHPLFHSTNGDYSIEIFELIEM